MEEATGKAVLERARAGDAEAWTTLYRQFSRRVFGLCRHLLGSREAAEDATSEVFVRVQRAMRSYDSQQPFPQWLLSIASHHCVDQLRRRRVEQRLFEADEAALPELPGADPTPLSELLDAEQRAVLQEAVGELPERLRLPLVLRYYRELSYQQIADELGLNRNTVATLILRGKKELRRRLAWSARRPA